MAHDIDEYREFPKCPYCGAEDQDWWDGLGNKNDGCEWNTNCGSCSKSYRVGMCVETSFRTQTIK